MDVIIGPVTSVEVTARPVFPFFNWGFGQRWSSFSGKQRSTQQTLVTAKVTDWVMCPFVFMISLFWGSESDDCHHHWMILTRHQLQSCFSFSASSSVCPDNFPSSQPWTLVVLVIGGAVSKKPQIRSLITKSDIQHFKTLTSILTAKSESSVVSKYWPMQCKKHLSLSHRCTVTCLGQNLRCFYFQAPEQITFQADAVNKLKCVDSN